MKKIISLLSAIAMMFTLITTVAFADENNIVYFEKTDNSATNITLKMVLKTDKTLSSFSAAVDLTDAYAKGAEITFEKLADSTVFSVNATQKVASTSITSVDGVTGTLELGTITFDLSKVTEDITLASKRAITAKDTDKVSVADDFSNTAYGYIVKAPVADTYGTPIETGDYAGKTLYFDDKTLTFVFGTHEGILIKKGAEEKKFGLKFFEDLGVSGEAGSEMTFTAGVIDASGATKGTYEFSLIEK